MTYDKFLQKANINFSFKKDSFMVIFKTLQGNFRAANVLIDGTSYDFVLFPQYPNKIFYRETINIGGQFSPITVNAKYKASVRKVILEVTNKLKDFYKKNS